MLITDVRAASGRAGQSLHTHTVADQNCAAIKGRKMYKYFPLKVDL